MNIKEWKKFSDAVDKHNREVGSFYDERRADLKSRETYWRKYDGTVWTDLALNEVSRQCEKSALNFYEWKCGKLKLK